MRKRTASAFAVALTLLAAPATAADAPVGTYNHVRLIDGTGAPAKSDMAIVVKGERIVAITPAIKAAKDVVDMHGEIAMPGMINTHVHLATWPNLPYAEAIQRRNLYAGITAVRDMAGDTRELGYIARESRIGNIPSPDVYYASLMAGPEFFHDPRTMQSTMGGLAPGQTPWMRAITEQTDLPLAIAEASGTGATAIKIYADLPAPLVAKITAEAHRQNLLVWAHAAVFPASPMQVADSGVDVMSHICMLGYQASAEMPRTYHNRAPVDAKKVADTHALDALFADMKRRGTIMDATLYVYQVLDKMKDANPPPYCTLALASKILGEAYRAGVPISAGTDADSDWKEPQPALADEMALLVKAGMTPMDAIRAATSIAARTIGQQRDMGTLEVGKLANIAFLSKDPLADIANAKSVTLTVKRGKQFPRSAFKPITRDEAKTADE
ncbi:MAG TPA: amidohydrolase family protein [Rhizomicrobium sp.]|nr:amidohydrolase family protein [Rhizomicrobium sp.]